MDRDYGNLVLTGLHLRRSDVSQNGIVAFDTSGTFKTFYQTYDASCASQSEIVDIIVTGKVSSITPRSNVGNGHFHRLNHVMPLPGETFISLGVYV